MYQLGWDTWIILWGDYSKAKQFFILLLMQADGQRNNDRLNKREIIKGVILTFIFGCFEENNSLEVQKTLNCPGLSPEAGVDWSVPLHPRTSETSRDKRIKQCEGIHSSFKT